MTLSNCSQSNIHFRSSSPCLVCPLFNNLQCTFQAHTAANTSDTQHYYCTFLRQTFLSTRKGAWVIGRMSTSGLPLDMTAITRFNSFLMKLLPKALVNWAAERALNRKYDHRLYGLQPRHRFFILMSLLLGFLPCFFKHLCTSVFFSYIRRSIFSRTNKNEFVHHLVALVDSWTEGL